MNFEKLAVNHFEDIRVGINKKVMFVNEHIMHMQAANQEGAFDNIIAETIPMYDVLSEIAINKNIATGKRKSSTKIVKLVISEFQDVVKDLSYISKVKFRNNLPVYLEAFPRGLSEYLRLNQGNFKPLLDRVKTFSENHISELGDEFALKFADIETRWLHELYERETIRGKSTASISELQLAWSNMTAQLYKNYLTILLLNYKTPKMAMVFFNPEIIRLHHKRKPKPAKEIPQNTETETKVVEE